MVICSYDYAADVPADIKAIMAKVPGTRSAGENEALKAYKDKGARLISKLVVPETPIYSVAFDPSGKLVAATGGDGLIRMIDAATGKIVRQFPAAPLTARKAAEVVNAASLRRPVDMVSPEVLPKGAKLVGLDVQPKTIEFNGPYGYVQLLVTGKLDSGDMADVTRIVKLELNKLIAKICAPGWCNRRPTAKPNYGSRSRGSR